MKILSFALTLFNELRSIIEVDLRSKRLVSVSTAVDNAYIKWSIDSLSNRLYFEQSVRIFFVFYLFILVLISCWLKQYFGESSQFYKIVATDMAIMSMMLFFGSQTRDELVVDLKKTVFGLIKIFAVILLFANSVFLFVVSQLDVNYSVPDILKVNGLAVLFLVVFGFVFTSIFRLVPFISSQIVLRFVYWSVKRSNNQSTNQFGHFLRYLGWPSLFITICHIVLLFI